MTRGPEPPARPFPVEQVPDQASGEARDALAEQRDSVAELRDDAACERHLQASARDLAAERRDDVVAELLTHTHSSEQLLDLLQQSHRSAAADRQVAAAHRHADTEDRLAAAADRDHAARARQFSASDRHEASLDPLTGAYTRASGFHELGRDVDRAHRTRATFTLAFVDVDGMKAINDTYGHAAGDRALQRVVHALRSHLRGHDLVIRFGGDEFLCALGSLERHELDRRFAEISRSLAVGPDQVRITVGFATLGQDESLEDLFTRADAAFYDNRRRR